ncbi:aldo/keto reductase [Streptomyces boncukensis]|uniref:Aldo/keto reductase n=1 Tax=Streptomyces boncukensis TaxID=2711219 RepID=A0A6G4WVN2_9ACTN|nr:aldo/keto reductase [Streptomyces boncukensis]NGO68667.1 aldo/keto reductase [Streptomyces boncukensis]
MPLTTYKVGQLSVSSPCLGGNVFGWGADEPTSFTVLDAYTAAGGNFIDTADAYSAWVEGNQGGESETVIGNWHAARGNRDDIVIATKAGAQSNPVHKGLAPATIRAALDDSLRRLRTDYVDLFYTHFDDESVPVADIVGTLDELVRAGKVREIAASNISPERLKASLAASEQDGLARYVALQSHYNLVERDQYEGALAQVAADAGLAVFPYYALASGFLTGKYRPDDAIPQGPRTAKASAYLETERGRRVLRALTDVADAHGASPATVSLAWLAAQPTVTAPIVSARVPDQLPALLALADLELTEAELAALTNASA